MTESEILFKLYRARYIDSVHRPHTPAWPVFVKQMAKRQMGPGECFDAWLWFAAGWEARKAVQ